MRQPGWTVGLLTRYQVLQGEPVVWALLLYPGLVGGLRTRTTLTAKQQ